MCILNEIKLLSKSQHKEIINNELIPTLLLLKIHKIRINFNNQTAKKINKQGGKIILLC